MHRLTLVSFFAVASIVWFAVAGQTHAAQPAVAAGADKRPNILFALADDWAWPHAKEYGDKLVGLPTFDRVAREGLVFNYAYVAAPTCTGSRAGILTGQDVHRLGDGANLNAALPGRFPVYPDLLEASGYVVGYTRKGWGPGGVGRERKRNPAGPEFANFAEFFKTVPKGKPFCFWFGSHDPHRQYRKDSGVDSGMNPANVAVPAFLPDTLAVRKDLLDYYFAVQRYDRDTGEIIKLIEDAGQLDNTMVVMSGDNGIPFPRAKATLYDAGTHAPLAVRWPEKVPGGRVVDDFVSLIDLAPTFVGAAGLAPPAEMTGRSFLDVLVSGKSGRVDPRRDYVVTERERHVPCREGDKSYPIRALRTYQFLYIRNFRPELCPSGDEVHIDNVMGAFGDVDNGPSKFEILARRNEPAIAPFFQAAFGKRPAEELYEVPRDPGQMHNLAGNAEYAEVLKKLRGQLDRWMVERKDPRAKGETDLWDKPARHDQANPKAKPRQRRKSQVS